MTPFLYALAFACSPDFDYPQWPKNWVIADYVRIVDADQQHLDWMLRECGAWWDCDGQAWVDVPFWARDLHAKNVANQRIKRAYRMIDWVTATYVHKDMREENASAFREEFGEEAWAHGLLPVPFSMR